MFVTAALVLLYTCTQHQLSQHVYNSCSVCVQKVLVKGLINLNRSFDGDTVVVAMLPESQWEAPNFRLPGKKPGQDAQQAENANDGASIAPVCLPYALPSTVLHTLS